VKQTTLKKRTGVLLINLGTPDSPNTSDVRKYLREFLMDGRVIDIPAYKRWMLVNLIIAPLRAPKSGAEYKKLWTEKGSPLLFHGVSLAKKMQTALGDDFLVSLGMRYQNPSIKKALEPFKDEGITDIVVVPLYPQYASASTGSTVEKVMKEVSEWQILPDLKFINRFPDHPAFIKAFTEIGKEYLAKGDYDHYLFSYHGLPERQIVKGSCDNHCKLSDDCCGTYEANNAYCYRAQCFATTRLLTAELGISDDQYSVSFQSRLGKTPWIKPYTDDVIDKLAAKGIKKVLIFSPSFVADCLETTIEIGEQYSDQFKEKGGEEWTLVESLNDRPVWVEALKEIILEQV
jgi:ferrochelatase